jgi:hypothetical protein
MAVSPMAIDLARAGQVERLAERDLAEQQQA